MNITEIHIQQANDKRFINQLYSAAQDIAYSDQPTNKAFQVIELIEDGKLLEAVMLEMNF